MIKLVENSKVLFIFIVIVLGRCPLYWSVPIYHLFEYTWLAEKFKGLGLCIYNRPICIICIRERWLFSGSAGKIFALKNKRVMIFEIYYFCLEWSNDCKKECIFVVSASFVFAFQWRTKVLIVNLRHWIWFLFIFLIIHRCLKSPLKFSFDFNGR